MTFYSKLWFWLLIIAVILLIIGAILFEWYNSANSNTEWWIWGVLILGVLIFLAAFVLYILEVRKQAKCCDPCVPREPVCPPREPVCPPREPVCPPREPVCPPREPVCPPREPVCPPREPVCPPRDSKRGQWESTVMSSKSIDSDYESEYEIRRISSGKKTYPPTVRTY